MTFVLPEDEGEHPFKGLKTGKTGQRFALALAKINDSEEKADHVFPEGYTDGSKPAMPYLEKTPGEQAVMRAGILANDIAFQDWLKVDGPELAAAYIRTACGVQSRSEFATVPAALLTFLTMEVTFKQQTGRMAEER